MTDERSARTRLERALDAPDPSTRLQAALAVGTNPQPGYVDLLVERCAVESDFYVRDMLTWALTQHDPASTFDRVVLELTSEIPQARSQGLHTLSKLQDPRTWSFITVDHLRDDDDEVARAAWRTAVAAAPEDQEHDLARIMATQLGRGDRDVQRSLSRAFVDLGAAAEPVVRHATNDLDRRRRTHAIATERLMRNPDEDFDAAVDEAKRTVALLGAPLLND